MNVYNGFAGLPKFKDAVATMGSFDGVHSGHLELLRRVKLLASEKGVQSVVLTFEPHPRYVLGTGAKMKLLSTLDEKLYLLEKAGIDNVVVIPFTAEFSRTSPRDFIEKDVVGIGVGRMVVGYNHRFGYNKEGDYDFLESRNEGLEIHMVEQQQIAGSKVSSTIIRQAVANGMIPKADKLLSHPYIIICNVKADGTLTDIDSRKQLPLDGVYEGIINGRAASFSFENGSAKTDLKGLKGRAVIEL